MKAPELNSRYFENIVKTNYSTPSFIQEFDPVGDISLNKLYRAMCPATTKWKAAHCYFMK
jgi:hypothetical protein